MDGTHARALLGVPEHASRDQIGRAFRGAAFGAHPDRGGVPARFRLLVEARDSLLASAPLAPRTSADPFARCLRDPAPPAWSALDSVRRPAAPATPAPSADDDFARVLADVLAEAA